MQNQRNWVLAALVVAILAVILLSTGLSQLELRPGNLGERQTLQELGLLISQFGIFRNVLIVLFILAPMLLFVLAWVGRRRAPVEKQTRERRPVWGILLQALMWAIAIVIIRNRFTADQFFLETPEMGDMPAGLAAGGGELLATQIPTWVNYSTSLVLVGALVLLAWAIWRRRQRAVNSLEMVAQEAQIALKDLQSGEDYRNVVLRCYHEMSRAVEFQRGIRRGQSMTPREFEYRLVELGLPEASVQQLTRLFESVRYGSKQPGGDVEHEAKVCLDAIIQASEGIS